MTLLLKSIQIHKKSDLNSAFSFKSLLNDQIQKGQDLLVLSDGCF